MRLLDVSQGGIAMKDESAYLTYALSKMTQALQQALDEKEGTCKALAERELALAALNKELESFTYTVSHDLRAPLRAISAFANFMEEDCKDALDAVGQGHLLEIHRGVSQMTQLLDDLLILSRVSRIRNPYEAVDMNQLVEKIKQQIAANLQNTDVTFGIAQNLPTIWCDRAKIERVYLNLLSNAIKFSTKTGRAITVDIGYNYREIQNEHIFYVADNGIGMEPKYHAQIFDLFTRLHSQDEYDGTGAGLTIVKRIIEDHKGKITVESELNKGAKFIFTIPS